jgi:uncharacterized protein
VKVERLTFDLVRVMMTRAAKGDDGPGTFVGHAAVFNKRAPIGDPKTWGFWEEIDPHAFDRALAEEQDVRFLVDHDPSRLLARTTSGTLDLSTDKVGLVSEAGLPDTTLGRDTRVLIDRGDLSQMSFGFIPRQTEWSTLDDGTELLRILDLDLFDVSVVTFPAYEETDAEVRSRVEAIRRTSPLTEARLLAARRRLDTLKGTT